MDWPEVVEVVEVQDGLLLVCRWIPVGSQTQGGKGKFLRVVIKGGMEGTHPWLRS